MMISKQAHPAIFLISFILFVFQAFSCKGNQSGSLAVSSGYSDTGRTAAYSWKKHTDSADFPESYNFQLFAIRDTLWAFHPAGNWYSVDGEQWKKSSLPNIIRNLAFLDYILYNGAVYGLGYFEGNIETFTYRPLVHQSADLRTWTKLADQSNLPERFFYHPFVFKNKCWIIGGSDKSETYSDIWSSSDGIHWERIRPDAGFGPRENSQIVELRDTLYMLNNDVWYSVNGTEWKQLRKEIVPGVEIFGYAAVVYDNRIWLLGCNRNGQFTSKVLSSVNGRDWQESDAPWSPRGGVAACVFKNRIYLTGGKYGGADVSQPDFQYSNDVWSMGGGEVNSQ